MVILQSLWMFMSNDIWDIIEFMKWNVQVGTFCMWNSQVIYQKRKKILVCFMELIYVNIDYGLVSNKACMTMR